MLVVVELEGQELRLSETNARLIPYCSLWGYCRGTLRQVVGKYHVKSLHWAYREAHSRSYSRNHLLDPVKPLSWQGFLLHAKSACVGPRAVKKTALFHRIISITYRDDCKTHVRFWTSVLVIWNEFLSVADVQPEVRCGEGNQTSALHAFCD